MKYLVALLAAVSLLACETAAPPSSPPPSPEPMTASLSDALRSVHSQIEHMALNGMPVGPAVPR